MPNTTPNTSSSSSGGFDWASLGGAFIGQFITLGFAKSEAEKNREFQEYLYNLDAEHREKIAIMMENAKSDRERQQMRFQLLAQNRANELLAGLKSKKYTAITVVGIGIIALATTITFVKIKQGKNAR
jgi:hypothetical protein